MEVLGVQTDILGIVALDVLALIMHSHVVASVIYSRSFRTLHLQESCIGGILEHDMQFP